MNNRRTSEGRGSLTPPTPNSSHHFLASPNSGSSIIGVNNNNNSNSFNNKRWGLSPSASSLLSLDLQTMSHQTPILHSLLASPNSSFSNSFSQSNQQNESNSAILLDEVLEEDNHYNGDEEAESVNNNHLRSCSCCETMVDQTILDKHAKETNYLCKYFFKVLPTQKLKILSKQQKDIIMEDQLLDDVLTSEEEDEDDDNINNEPNLLDAQYLNLISKGIQQEASTLEKQSIFNYVISEPFWRMLENSIVYTPDNSQSNNNMLSTSPSYGGPNSPGTLMMKIYSSSTTNNYANNSTLVHIAAKHNRVEILDWLKSCCCDQDCCSSKDSHSSSCISRQMTLWNLKDNNGSTPLFSACQGCPTSTSHEAGVFMMSQMQTLDPLSKYIHQVDNYGNSPISICMRKRDWKMSDLLILFGANLDSNTGAFGESLLHTSMRELDMQRVEFIAKRAPRALLKKNQKEENALFCLVKDFRCNTNAGRSFILGSPDFCITPESSSPTSPYSETKSALRTAVNRAFPKEQRINFIRLILESGSSLFGREVFEKSLSLKNQHGRNFLLESVTCGDHVATKEIVNSLCILSLVAEECCSDPRKLMESIVFTSDRQSKNIIHLSIEFATRRMNQHNREDYQTWLDSFYFLLSWMDENLAFGALFNRECTSLLCGKDMNGLIPQQYLEKEIANNQNDIRWKNVLDILKSYESKWNMTSKTTSTSGNTSKRSSVGKKQSIFFFLTSQQPSDEFMTPKKMKQLARKSGSFSPKKPIISSDVFSKDSALFSESKDRFASPLISHKESLLDQSTLYSNSSQSIVSSVSSISNQSNVSHYSEPPNRTQKIFSGIMKKLTGKNKSNVY